MSVINIGGIADFLKKRTHGGGKVPYSHQPKREESAVHTTKNAGFSADSEDFRAKNDIDTKLDGEESDVDDDAGAPPARPPVEKVEMTDGACTVAPARSCTAGESVPANSLTIFKKTAFEEKTNADLIAHIFEAAGMDPRNFLVVPLSSCEEEVPEKCHAELIRMPSLVTERVRVTLKDMMMDSDDIGSYDVRSGLKKALAILIRGLYVSSKVQVGNTCLFPLGPEDGSGISVDMDGTLRVCLFDTVIVTGAPQNRCQKSAESPQGFSSTVNDYFVSLTRLLSPKAASAGKDAHTLVKALEAELSNEEMARYRAMQSEFFP